MAVVSSLCYVSDPLSWLVIQLVLDPEVSNAQATACEHRHLYQSASRLTWKSREIGGRLHCFSCFKGVTTTSALIKNSMSPWNFLMRHMIAFWSGSYLALPLAAEKTLTVAALGGTGILATTFEAKLVLSKIALILTLYSSLFSSGYLLMLGSKMGLLLNHRDNFERKVDVLANAVGHEFECTIRRHKRNGPVSVETAEAHALMELDIINLDSAVLSFGGICVLD